MKGTKSNKLISPGIRVMFMPVVYIIILIIVSITAFRIGTESINKQRKELKNTQKAENTLREKETELNANISKLPPLVTPSTMALPNTNPALMIISHFKSLVTNRDIGLEDFKVSGGGSGKADVSALGIQFTISGDFLETMEFLKDTKNVVPIILVDRLKIGVDDERADVDAAASSYSSPYPDKLPPVTEPIDMITDEEFAILYDIVLKDQPAFFELSPTGPTIRTNPFDI